MAVAAAGTLAAASAASGSDAATAKAAAEVEEAAEAVEEVAVATEAKAVAVGAAAKAPAAGGYIAEEVVASDVAVPPELGADEVVKAQDALTPIEIDDAGPMAKAMRAVIASAAASTAFYKIINDAIIFFIL